MKVVASPPLFLFDAHNHIHLGGASPCMIDALSRVDGMALMSTHPRDFPAVSHLCDTGCNRKDEFLLVPCFGVHPWFLHQVEDGEEENGWLKNLTDQLDRHPHAAVGEIGLDGHRFHPQSRNLVSSMDDQVQAMEAQMRVAHSYQRACSIHAVQCWGPLMTLLSKLKRERQLPPKLYFHAFGAKVGFVDQLLALFSGQKQQTELFFGFAPVINLSKCTQQHKKTAEVISKVGMDRIVLETDVEDASCVYPDLMIGAQFLSDTLKLPLEDVVKKAWDNAMRLYGISS